MHHKKHGFFYSTWKEGKVTVKESESVTDTTLYFLHNTTRLIVCNFTLPSPGLELYGVESLQRNTEVSKSCNFLFGFGITSMGVVVRVASN